MKFYSEVTKRLYDSQDELTKDERKVATAEAEKKAAEAKKSAERAARAKEVEDAYKAEVEAHAKYIKLRNQFVDDYGSFHMSYTTSTPEVEVRSPYTLFDTLFNLL